ncbi:hypothetical protein C2G38_2090732 [Gigaspora rosea]|uniref:Serine-threonine/tyrosine-protein kinase catalytic domain-containing protein n=1 Tax=Gigaspora rosea TaxID=44941 RepID=A0A397V385_9GLOM|nr:hypothetical protein C2G38_2090732 [Gigaspora rosea]
MWEILYGSPVLYDCALKMQELQIEICCNDLRPPINKEASRRYVNLIKECWDKDPEKRPSTEKLCEIFKEWQNNENIILELNGSKTILENIEKSYVNTFDGGSKFISYTHSIFKDSELQNLTL